MRTVTCNCENTFEADLPDEIDLDTAPELTASIADGSFLSCACPACGTLLHTDVEARVLWASHGMKLALVPELSRMSVLSGRQSSPEGFELVIGYAELADRVAVYSARLNPVAVETLKFHLIEKALETAPDRDPVITFERTDAASNLVFYVHGLRDQEVAVTTVPRTLYNTIESAVILNPEAEPQSLLKNGSWVSARNIRMEASDNA